MRSVSGKQMFWSSPAAFVFASAGAAIGLGNVWRLPYLAGEYGGGAFLLVYVLALVSMGLPILVAELLLGRHVRSDVVTTMRAWSRENGQSRWWASIGHLALIGAAMVLSYSSVIAGWSLAYLLRAAGGALAQLDAAGLAHTFAGLVDDPEKGLGWHTIFMVAATIIASHGLRRGLEPGLRILLVAAFVVLAVLLLMAGLGGHLGAALAYLLRPDFGALGWRGIVEAFHQAFFSLSLGVGVMIAFGGYLRDEVSLVTVSVIVLVLDTLFAFVSGLVVMSLLLGAGLAPAPGLKLLFQVFPAAALAGGHGWMLLLFFLMLVLATLTSAVALMEPIIVWMRRRFGISRVFAASATGLLAWFMGLGTLLSFNLLENFTLLDRTVFDWLALVSSRILLPLVGLLVCLFVGRFLHPRQLVDAWHGGVDRRGLMLWQWMLRYPARIGLILVVLYAIGVFTFVENLW